MMLKKIVTLRTPNGVPFLSTGVSLASKVIRRTLSEESIEVEGKWDLLSAVCLERHPVITRPMQDLETRYQEMLEQIQFENSLMSNFELKKEAAKNRKDDPSDSDHIMTYQMIQDLEDSWEDELEKFKLAPRVSETKEDNIVASLKRKLDKNLVLLVEQNIGNTSFWIPPQSARKQTETMIQTAKRTLQELCGSNVRVQFYGNAPIGFYKYKYPKSMQDTDKDGAKIFYFLAKYISGHVSPDVNHCWLDRNELKKRVPPTIYKSLSKFLLPD
ncbi:39S ribosomal protein L46, mitochondrial [Ceratina calcarata]|uniref:Large ribosomal subunit protein mL46 n=1 Tax=Ceratina calcarata TaxID=156304 RepID=A0AAJ7J8Z4_9HYME|nr:39S ribosomal protein L46, mitochondrial [Ceratina calcarata]